MEVLAAALALAPGSARDRLNHGLALLRTGRTAAGVAELEQAQREDPTLPHTWFNLGIAYKHAGRIDDAIAQLERMAALVPDEAKTAYNLGVLYKLRGDTAAARAAFERAARLDPRLAAPWFQLAAADRQAGRTADAERAMDTFRALKEAAAGQAIPEDLEWSYYSELYDPVTPAAPAPPVGTPTFDARRVAAGRTPGGGLEVLDADGDGGADLAAFSAAGVVVLAGGRTPLASGLEGIAGVRDLAAGDFDDDGLPDLALLDAAGAALFRNAGGGRFARLGVALPDPGPGGRVVWLDFDHDYDQDLLLLGPRPAVVRNQGAGSFAVRPGALPLVAGRPTAVAALDLVADTQGMDLVVAYADRPGTLYRDLLGGRYEARELPAVPAGATDLVARDLDGDGWTDLAVATPAGPRLLRNDHREGFTAAPLPAPADGAPAALAALDVGSRGAPDLVAGASLSAARGAGRFATPGPLPALAGGPRPTALAAADFDGDGRDDLAAVAGADVVLLTNRTPGPYRHLTVSLTGVKNPKLAPRAEVEVKAAGRYQKRTWRGVPLVFGLAGADEAEVVRITWPNGLIQNETHRPAGDRASLVEAPRLSGSCPMIFTWDGSGFSFISDVLGVAPLGAAAGDGTYFDVDHDELVAIPGERLAARDGAYEVRMTEELREVSYLDQVRLLAVDHPARLEVLTDEKFKGPPYPAFRLWGVERRLRPREARDDAGRDVRERLLATDGSSPDGFRRDFAGRAAVHSLTLDFGPDPAPDGRALLVLHGWVDWADGSTFLATAQRPGGALVMPYLEAEDATGRWVRVLDDMGLPAGKPKTIVVDLSGRLPPGTRRLRIVTSLCVYWDEIYLSPDTAAPPAVVTPLHPAAADLGFRGFSRVEVDPRRLQPERFVYADVRPTTMWNPTPGLYTRYGPVAELLAAVDDRFVVMGSGDEVRMRFPAAGLPALRPGWRRDFLLFVDGWAKDGDANTAHSQTVGPLPFHAMPAYPYGPPNHFPDDPAHRRYLEDYEIRPALRLVRPLAPAASPVARPAER